jgi:Tfp pilus assembly protein PilN
VLAMIEVNLLPPEYRPRESTNVSLMVTLIGGLAVLGGLVLWWLSLNSKLDELTLANETLTRKRDDLKVEEAKVDKLKEEIARQKARQETIIEISQSKIMWSQKLEQLANILAQSGYEKFWVSNMSLAKSSKGATFTLKFSGIGNSLSDVASLRDTMKNDANFFYHFSELRNLNVKRVALEGYANATEKMEFEIALPLESPVQGPGGHP